MENSLSNPLTERVLSALASVKHIEREKISLEGSLEELGFDSLDITVLLFELEKQFQVNIPDDQLSSLHTVRDVVQCVSQLVAAGASLPAPPVASDAVVSEGEA